MRIGTRGSALALRQAHWVAQQLSDRGVEVEVEVLTTSGDRGEQLTDKSRWVGELERALLEDRIDLAVHSAKDVPADLADGTELVAFPVREDPRDALCGAHSLGDLRTGARLGTSSLRRAAQLRAVRDDLEVVELRGNVDTRLRRLEERAVDAIVLAVAGLRRLGLETAVGGVLDELVPAAGQGALALQARAGASAGRAARELDDPATAASVSAERALTAALGASCQTAVGAHARPIGIDDQLELRAWVGLPDGSEWISDRRVGPPAQVGAEVAGRLLSAGAADLLARAAAP